MKTFFILLLVVALLIGGLWYYKFNLTNQDISSPTQNPTKPNTKDTNETGGKDASWSNLGDDPGEQDIVFSLGNSLGQIQNNLEKGIYTVQSDGEKIFFVTKGWEIPKDSVAGKVSKPQFSPDGKYILFSGNTLSGSFYVVSAKGGAVNQIAPEVGFEPSGGWINSDEVLLWSDKPSGGAPGITLGSEKHFYVYSASKNTSKELTSLTSFEKKYTQRILTGNGFFITTGIDTSGHLRVASHKDDGSVTGEGLYKWIGLQTVGEPAAASPTQLIWLIKKGGSESIVAKDGFYLLDAATGALTLLADETSYLKNIAATFGPTQPTIFPNPKNSSGYLYTTAVAPREGTKVPMVKLIYREPNGTIGRFTKDSADGGLSSEVGASWSPLGTIAAFTDSAAFGLGSAIYTATYGAVPQLLVPYGDSPNWNPVAK